MNEHTPGPWEVGHKLVDPNLHLSVHEAKGWTIANCDMTIRKTEENEANARLIAAAPELLAACEALITAILEAVEQQEDVWYPAIRTAHKAAQSAIAKATGEQS